jgi:hypothetical protein
MMQATAKFTNLMTRKLWGAKSPDEEQLIAMIADLKGKLKLLMTLLRSYSMLTLPLLQAIHHEETR